MLDLKTCYDVILLISWHVLYQISQFLSLLMNVVSINGINNDILGLVPPTPLNVEKIRQEKRQMQSIWFLQGSSKSFWTTFKTIFETLSALGACHVTNIGGVVYKISMIFKVFGVYFASFWYFFMKPFLVVRSYRVLVTSIKSLIMGALVTLGARLKVPILAVFDDFGHFLSCLFRNKPLF